MIVAVAAAAAAGALAAVVVVAIDVADDSHCVDVVAIPIVQCCCQVFDAYDNDNDFVDFQACKKKKQEN